MQLIIGGAFQGKAKYALGLVEEMTPVIDFSVDSCQVSIEEVCKNRVILNLHLYIRALLESGRDPYEACSKLDGDIIITINELGCGVVPIDRKDREYREVTGRISCILAGKSDRVIRMTCGIPVQIK